MRSRERYAHQFAAALGVTLANEGYNEYGIWWDDSQGSTHITDWPAAFRFLADQPKEE